MEKEKAGHNFNEDERNKSRESLQSYPESEGIVKRDEEPIKSEEPVVEGIMNKIKWLFSKILGRG